MSYSIDALRTQLIRAIADIPNCSSSHVPHGGYPDNDREAWLKKTIDNCLWRACKQYWQDPSEVREALFIEKIPYRDGALFKVGLRIENVVDDFSITIPYSQVDAWCNVAT